jgi:hypothetical protein
MKIKPCKLNSEFIRLFGTWSGALTGFVLIAAAIYFGIRNCMQQCTKMWANRPRLRVYRNTEEYEASRPPLAAATTLYERRSCLPILRRSERAVAFEEKNLRV